MKRRILVGEDEEKLRRVLEVPSQFLKILKRAGLQSFGSRFSITPDSPVQYSFRNNSGVCRAPAASTG
jgi:hypothetical protein